nr:growth hormone-regulated TBC protein 1-A-like [Penaeus vannamei]
MALQTNSRLSDVDEYGFERPPDFDYQNYEEFMSRYLSVLTRRARKWSHLLGAKETVGRGIKVKRYVRKGIPMKHRGKMWMEVSGGRRKMEAHPGYYKSLLEGSFDEEVVESIKIDVPRTFPDNIYFRDYNEGKLTDLYNVLVAFAHHNKKIGYCQQEAMPFIEICSTGPSTHIAGPLLDHITERRGKHVLAPEFRSKNLLLSTISGIDSLRSLLTDISVGIPCETVLRIWDCLFYEGNKILMRVAIILVLSNEQKILMSQDFGDFMECFKKITKDADAIDCHTFMENAFKVSGSFPRARLAKLRDECKEEVRAEMKK